MDEAELAGLKKSKKHSVVDAHQAFKSNATHIDLTKVDPSRQPIKHQLDQ